MKIFETLTSWAATIPDGNIDTDQIFPGKYLKTVKRQGLGKVAFESFRFEENGNPNPDFVFNQPPFDKAAILVAGPNFGCGSSREHAIWALADMGIRAIISEQFADIFAANAQKNGMLLVQMAKRDVEKISKAAKTNKITIDLPAQVIKARDGELKIPFAIDPFEKTCLLEGFDHIALTLRQESKITSYEDRWRKKTPWLFHD